MNDAVDDVEVDGVLKLSEGAMNARVMGGTRYSRTHGSVIEEEEPCGQLVETIDGVRLAGGEEEPGSEAPEENEGPVVAGHGRGCARCGERKPGCTCCTCFRPRTVAGPLYSWHEIRLDCHATSDSVAVLASIVKPHAQFTASSIK